MARHPLKPTMAAVLLALLATLGCGKESGEEAAKLRAEAEDWRAKHETLSAKSAAAEKELASLQQQVAELSAERDSAEADLKAALARMEDEAAARTQQPPPAANRPAAPVLEGGPPERVSEPRQRLEELGALLFERGEFSIALPVSQSALDLGSDGPETLYRIAYCRHSLGQYEAAVESYEQALARLEADPDPDADLLAKCLNNCGVAELKLGNADRAAALFLKAIAVDEKCAPAYFNLGLAYANELKRPQEAIEAFRKHIICRGNQSVSAKEFIARLQAAQPPPSAAEPPPPERAAP